MYEIAQKLLPLHVVTDCDSLHEIVVKTGLPEDKRAAIEVVAIREVMLGEDACDSDVDPTTERLCEHNFKDYYNWTVSEDQMADALTKVLSADQRREWMNNLNWISIRQSKKKELRLQKSVPVKPRQQIDRAYAKLAVQVEAEELRAAAKMEKSGQCVGVQGKCVGVRGNAWEVRGSAWECVG